MTAGPADPLGTLATDTAVRSLGDGRYDATIDPSWWIIAGPNGGYVAAIVLRAVVAEVADPARRPRSATFHYLRSPAAGPVQVEVTVERSGRTITAVSARLTQDGRTLVTALVALGVDRDAPVSFDEDPGLPVGADGSVVPPPEQVPLEAVDPERHVPMRDHYDLRWVLGAPPFTSGDAGPAGPRSSARCGGWMRLREDDPVAEVVLVAMADAWLPPVFSRIDLPLAVPTVDLTVHFRGRPGPDPSGGGDGWVFGEFASPVGRDGYLVETGRLLDRTGRMLAEVRQTALVLTS
jgi:acyl-CoA thioesterase